MENMLLKKMYHNMMSLFLPLEPASVMNKSSRSASMAPGNASELCALRERFSFIQYTCGWRIFHRGFPVITYE